MEFEHPKLTRGSIPSHLKYTLYSRYFSVMDSGLGTSYLNSQECFIHYICEIHSMMDRKQCGPRSVAHFCFDIDGFTFVQRGFLWVESI